MGTVPVFYHAPWSLHSHRAKKLLDATILEYETVEATLEVMEGLSVMAEIQIFPVLQVEGIFYEGLAQIEEFITNKYDEHFSRGG